MKRKFKSFGFTLAEVMITLVVIGVITGIVVPIMINSAPDKNVMKFKKADTTLKNVIRELVNSDQYYMDGDLGIRKDGTLIDGTHDGDKTYFCKTIADIVSTKSVNCSSVLNACHDAVGYNYDKDNQVYNCAPDDTCEGVIEYKDMSDVFCVDEAQKVGPEIVLSDGTVIYQTSPADVYGKPIPWVNSPNSRFYKMLADDSIHIQWYKTICIDIDGIPSEGSKNCDDEKDVCPFGYGISTEGHIIIGARAKQWLAKDFNGKDESEQ